MPQRRPLPPAEVMDAVHAVWDTPAAEPSPQPDNLNYWFGRKVLNSYLLAEDLIDMCGGTNVFTTDGTDLALPLVKRHGFSGHTRDELESMNDSIVSKIPTAGDAVTIDLMDSVWRYGQGRDGNLLVAAFDRTTADFSNLQRLHAAINNVLNPAPKSSNNKFMGIRIAERVQDGDVGAVKKRIARSGLFVERVKLGPVEVCSSIADNNYRAI